MNTFIYLTLTIGVFDLIATVSAKFFSLKQNPWLLVLTVVCFGIAGILFAYSIKLNSLAIANIAWIAISVLFVTLFDYLYFKESMSLIQFAGLIFVLTGFIMINLQDK